MNVDKSILKTYLNHRFVNDNADKYHRHFNLWYSNLTITQLQYFETDYLKSLK